MAKQALGRGLSALLATNEDVNKVSSANDNGALSIVGKTAELEIATIQTNPYQPRTSFDQEQLEELSASIKNIGIIQPITVRKIGYNQFQLISGERRLRASKMAGLTHIPAYVRITDDQDMLTLALIENIQRSDLDPIEISLSYQNLIQQCNITQEQLSEKLGKKRSTITNYLRLLTLDPIIQSGIRDRMLSMGHGRALVNIDSEEVQLDIYEKIISENLSVRQTEELAKQYQEGKFNQQVTKKPKRKSEVTSLSEEARLLGKELQNRLEVKKLEIKLDDKGKGKVSFIISSVKDLERILASIKSNPEN